VIWTAARLLSRHRFNGFSWEVAHDGHGVPNAPRLFNVDYERFDKIYSIGVRYRM
jgi:hypothetical protein